MAYIPLSNYKYDEGFHQLQSGPSFTADDLNLTEKYLVVSSGYVDALGNTVNFYGVNNLGVNFGRDIIGPPPQDIVEPKRASVINVNSAAYSFSGDITGANPSFTVTQGQTLILSVAATGHPLWIKTKAVTGTGDAVYSNIINNGIQKGTITWAPREPGTYFYICQIHSLMQGTITVLENPLFNTSVAGAWRNVPPAMEGFWTDYQNVDFAPSGLLSSYDGYRGLSVVTIANAKVSTAAFPQPGLRTTGKYTYFGGFAPSNQGYDPYNTPGDSSPALGLTGGGVTHGRSEGGILTNPFSTSIGSGTSTRADWVYNPPVYCQTFTESIRATSPAGNMSTVTRYIYRGHASTYVSNYAAIYGFAPEGVRGLIRHYSPTVNSSNQKNV